jgi:hypothetical protein
MRRSSAKWIAIVLGGCLAASAGIVTATDVPTAETPDFGEYRLVPLLDDGSSYAGPGTPTTLDGVHIGEWIADELSPEALTRLAQQGFVVMPSRDRLFHEAYIGLDWDGTPTFVTTDAAYHSWHLVFDKILREVEQQRLLPALEELTTGLRRNAKAQAAELAGTELADDAARVHDLLLTTAAVLKIPKVKLTERASAELALIRDHSTSVRSPILESLTDYSLFTPRGHYTRNEDLERYFVAMSVMGQHAFQLPGARDPDGSIASATAGLRRAVLATRILVGHPELEELWRTIFEPSAFLVGVSDDYTPAELAAAVEKTVPGGISDPLLVADADTLLAIARTLMAERPVRIDPERPSVRLMGTRFVLDSWILDQLVGPNVGTRSDPRVLGSPLDLAAAFGSDFALAIQDEAGQTAKTNYPEQMDAMRGAVAARPDAAWGKTVYDAWLAAVEPMWLPRGEAFPDFMRSDAWKAKSQQTGFGSYAELKHDTILYTKQAFGDTGGGWPASAGLRHWVEPDPVPFERLASMATLTRDGLKARGLLPKAQRQLLDQYTEFVDRLASIARRELAGKPSRPKDNDWLMEIDDVLESIWAQSGDEVADWDNDVDKDAAIIADIMRGVDGPDDQVIEIGTGYIDRLYVIVPDDDGTFRVARGGVFSYYEFPWPTPDRLNDTTWRKMLAHDEAPSRPTWTAPLFPASGVGSGGTAAPTPQPSKWDLEFELSLAIPRAEWEPYRRSPKGAAFDPFEAGARTGVIFERTERDLHKKVDYVALFAFESTEDLASYWQLRAEAAAAVAPEREGACLDGQPGRADWDHGQLLCYVSDSGRAVLRWTDERSDTYGVMNAVAGETRVKVLAKQWQEIV